MAIKVLCLSRDALLGFALLVFFVDSLADSTAVSRKWNNASLWK